jgi:hypothetical protein
MKALFDLADYERVVHDPYWDEIVLDASTPIPDKAGQLTLIYDDSAEPPDPDDYPSLIGYLQAWELWEENHPNSLHGFSTPAIDEEGVSESSSPYSPPAHVSIPNTYIERVSDIADDDSVTDSLTPHGCITTYSPRGEARGDKRYFRYSYRGSGRVHHHHIPGGNCSSKLAQSRAEKVRQAIAQGKAPTEIIAMIKSF